MLEIKNLHANIGEKPILRGIDLTVPDGEIHAIMGPNGSGKSTLSYVLSGREDFEVTGGSVTFDGTDLLAMEPEERAQAGIFLAFQAPVELPGVGNANFLRTALNAIRRSRGETELDAAQFLKLARAEAKRLQMPDDMLKRNVNVGFSGGEKKRNEVLQMTILQPKLAILDETDSGLDIDALKIVGDGVNALRSPNFSSPGHHPSPAAARAHQAGCGACARRRPNRAHRRCRPRAAAGGAGLCAGQRRGSLIMADATIVEIRPQASAIPFIRRYEGLRSQLPAMPNAVRKLPPSSIARGYPPFVRRRGNIPACALSVRQVSTNP